MVHFALPNVNYGLYVGVLQTVIFDKYYLYLFPAEQATLLVSNRYYIRNVTLDGKHMELLAMHLNNAVALDFDYQVTYIIIMCLAII